MKCKKAAIVTFFFICSALNACLLGIAHADIGWVKYISPFNQKEIAFLQENLESLKEIGWEYGMDDQEIMRLLNESLEQSAEKKKECQYNVRGLAAQYALFNKKDIDLNEAADWYKSNACRDTSLALSNLAMIHVENENLEEAIELFKAAADKGFVPAQFCLAYLYYQKYPVIMSRLSKTQPMKKEEKGKKAEQQDTFVTLANAWLKQSVEQGYPPAKYLMAEILGKCASVIKDNSPNPSDDSDKLVEEYGDEIKKLINEAAEAEGFLYAVYMRGLYYQRGKIFERNSELALENMKKAADKGFIHAKCCYGKWLTKGIAVAKSEENEKEGVKLWLSVAEQGHPRVDYELGVYYYEKNGSKDREFLPYMKRAAEKNYALALTFLGQWYSYRKYSGKDYDEKIGVTMLEKAAELGNSEAQNALAVKYKEDYFWLPLIQTKRAKQIVRLFECSALKNNPYAYANLARVHYQGDFGISKDKREALSYYKKAKDFGFKTKGKEYNDIKMDYDLSREYYPADYDETSLEEVEVLFEDKLVNYFCVDNETVNEFFSLGTVDHRVVEDTGESLFLQGLAHEYGLSSLDASKEKAMKYYERAYTEKEFSPAACHTALLKASAGTEDGFRDAEALAAIAIGNEDSKSLAKYCLAKINFKKAKLLEKEAKDYPDKLQEVERLRQEAEALLKESAEKKFPPAEYCLGCWKLKKDAYNAANILESMDLIGSASDHGLAAAQCLSYLLAKRKMMSKEYNRSDLLRKAAKQNHIPAMNAFGEWFLRHPTRRSMYAGKAIAALNKAADQGDDAIACYNLGKAYQRGAGLAADAGNAVAYYRKAAEKGLKIAEAALKKMPAQTVATEPEQKASAENVAESAQ